MLEIIPSNHRSLGETIHCYEQIHRRSGILHLDSFYLWVLERLAPRSGSLFLDVACGLGRLPYLAHRYRVCSHGTDFSQTAIRQARQRQGSSAVHYAVADGEALPYRDNAFDAVASIGSLEHYRNPLVGTKEIARVLVPSGRALILLPNTFSLLHNVWAALRSGRTGSDGQPIQRFAALNEWKDLLENGGLQVIRVYKYEREFPRSLADARWYVRHPKELLRLLLTPIVPLAWASCFAYLCRKSAQDPKTRPQNTIHGKAGASTSGD